MPLVLHEHPLSPYVQKVKIALLEKGVPFETAMPNVGPGADVGAFAALNPRLEVPVLVDDDVAIFGSTITLEYIEDKWPTPPLRPDSPRERAQARMIEEICDTSYEAINWAVMEIRVFQRATGALADELLATAARQTGGMNAWLTRQLGGREWLNGARFGWADLAAVPLVAAAANLGTPPAPGSPLAAWLDRMQARPSVRQTFDAATAAMTGFEMLPQLVASGLFKREYRDHRLEWMLRSGGTEIVLAGMRNDNIRFSCEIE
jgi:glutathione S-transferase